jgi:mono/diheme cytochrome c family protein
LKHSPPVCATLLLVACQEQPLAGPSGSTPQSRGRAFAQASCAACHAIGRDSTSSPNPKAPPFPAIVNQQDLTAETLSSWLRDAHNYPSEMEFQLDSSKVDDLVTYMLTLSDPNYRPPS